MRRPVQWLFVFFLLSANSLSAARWQGLCKQWAVKMGFAVNKTKIKAFEQKLPYSKDDFPASKLWHGRRTNDTFRPHDPRYSQWASNEANVVGGRMLLYKLPLADILSDVAESR